jgi:hypothetical protein
MAIWQDIAKIYRPACHQKVHNRRSPYHSENLPISGPRDLNIVCGEARKGAQNIVRKHESGDINFRQMLRNATGEFNIWIALNSQNSWRPQPARSLGMLHQPPLSLRECNYLCESISIFWNLFLLLGYAVGQSLDSSPQAHQNLLYLCVFFSLNEIKWVISHIIFFAFSFSLRVAARAKVLCPWNTFHAGSSDLRFRMDAAPWLGFQRGLT